MFPNYFFLFSFAKIPNTSLETNISCKIIVLRFKLSGEKSNCFFKNDQIYLETEDFTSDPFEMGLDWSKTNTL